MSIVEKAVKTQAKPRLRSKEPATLSVDARAGIAGEENSEPTIQSADFTGEALVEAGFRSGDKDADWQLAKQFRRIKRPIIRFSESHRDLGSEHGNVIMVGSAVPREGKTFCAVNLALALAREPETDVLLIDADVCRPALSSRVGLKNSIGLLDFLDDSSLLLEDVVRETGYDSLSFISAGQNRDGVHELLAGARAKQIIDEAASGAPPNRNRNRIVVVDSPPLLPTTEAQIISGLVGMVVMVVDSKVTAPDLVTQALAQIDPDKPVNYILNRADIAVMAGYQGGYYGHGYGYESDAYQA